MQSHQIISGFSDIKSELQKRTGMNKQMSELRLWFSRTDDVLYAHDYDLHRCCIMVAIKTGGGWNIRLDPRTFGSKLILETLRDTAEEEIINELHRLYREYGAYC